MGVEIGGIIEEMHEDEEGRRIIDKVKITHLALVPDKGGEDEKCPITGEPPVRVWPSCVRRCGLTWRGWEDDEES